MRNRLPNWFVLILITLLGVKFACAQNSTLDAAGEKVREYKAHQAFYRGDYFDALTRFKSGFEKYPKDAELAYWVGECYFFLNDFVHAKEYFEKAIVINPSVNNNANLDLGKSYQNLGELDKAIAALNLFKSKVSSSKTLKESDVDHFIAQCNVAKELMAQPVDVKIVNLGNLVNSKYDDKRPSLTADGKKMIFTSRRPREKDSPIDREGDGKYFEDIYSSNWDSVNKVWGAPELLPGGINTEFHDAACSISPDGKQIFVYKNDPKLAKGGDIWVSKLNSSGKWGTPHSIGAPINTSYWEDGACLSPDGNTLFFISEMDVKGAQGHGDIYYSTRDSKAGAWKDPINMGPDINTPYDEGGVFMAADGKTLFFCSEGHNSMGSYDIFKTVFENGQWSKPINIGYPINTIGAEKSFVLTADGKTAYIASDRAGGFGERDIYQIDLTNYPLMGKSTGKAAMGSPSVNSIVKGSVVSTDGAKGMGVLINFFNQAGEKVAETHSSQEDGGAFFITLPAGKIYMLVIEQDGYDVFKENFFMPASGDASIYTMIKDIILYKK